jgi:hypothetical protein
MYDTPDFFLVANPIRRYSIGDRTPGLHTADDGSLTIFMQRDEPQSPQERANWLPAPDGDFRPILRMYEPGGAVFDGRYELPPITRTGGTTTALCRLSLVRPERAPVRVRTTADRPALPEGTGETAMHPALSYGWPAMCTHGPRCSPAGHIERVAGHVIASHPG